ncbi:SH3 domain-containing protein [Bartonella sp. CB189]|uniref:SH3 domain-containing protein n=1 Tax=Bartonella sp. CB189 TaxID=3112254 RepID=UPI002F961649
MKKLIFFFAFSFLFLFTKTGNCIDAFVTENLNFRMGPSVQSAFRGLIPAGQLIFVQVCRQEWCYIRYNAQTGWVSSRYLSFKDGNDLYRSYTRLSFTNNIHY